MLLALTRALSDKVHRPCVLEHQGLILFLIVGPALGLPRVLLPIVPERGVVLQLRVHGLGWGWVLRVVLLLKTMPE
jgi:hypothetical protein